MEHRGLVHVLWEPYNQIVCDLQTPVIPIPALTEEPVHRGAALTIVRVLADISEIIAKHNVSDAVEFFVWRKVI